MVIQRSNDTNMWIVVNPYSKLSDSGGRKFVLHDYQYYAEFSQQGNIKIVLDSIDIRHRHMPVSEEDLSLFYNEVHRDGATRWIPLICNGILS